MGNPGTFHPKNPNLSDIYVISKAMKKSILKKDPILAEIKQRLTETIGDNVERIILFGSRARGDAHKDYSALFLRHPITTKPIPDHDCFRALVFGLLILGTRMPYSTDSKVSLVPLVSSGCNLCFFPFPTL